MIAESLALMAVVTVLALIELARYEPVIPESE